MYIMIIVMILLGLQDGVQAQGQLQRKDGNDGGDGGGNGHPHRMQHQGQILGKIAVIFLCVLCGLSLKINVVGQKTLTPVDNKLLPCVQNTTLLFTFTVLDCLNEHKF